MKTKSKDHKPETQEKNPEIQQEEDQIDEQQTQQIPHQSLQAANNNNKRKAMEQGISPETERTRPRYSGIATVV